MAEHVVVCIARQFGSAGHDVGLALAQTLQIPFYDKELLKEAADKSGIMQELFEQADERPTSGLQYPAAPSEIPKAASFADYIAYLPNDRIQGVIADVIRDAANKSSCVIIGRCADYILRGRPNILSVFIHAPVDMRVQRVAKMHNLSEDNARSLVRKTDRSRANYYSFYTDRNWGDASNYDLSIDTGRLGIEKSAQLVQAAVGLFIP